ncbi:MAG: glycosyl hydrolase family 28-related protein [Nitrospirota bacterium]
MAMMREIHRGAAIVCVSVALIAAVGKAHAEDFKSLQDKDKHPVVLWASDPVRPDEVVLLSGGNFGSKLKLQATRISDSAKTGRPSKSPFSFPDKSDELKHFQQADHSVKFIVPSDLSMGLFAVRLTNEMGSSALTMLNRPDPWWLQGDEGGVASPGGWVRVFGKCLSFTGKKASVYLEGKGKIWQLPASEANTWSVTFSAPRELEAGNYSVRVHNGFGGDYGWSAPLSVVVRQKIEWPETTFNVVEFGADPAGLKDSTSAVKKALAQAEANKGGIVFFPRGRYMLSEGLKIPRHTTMKGEDRELSCIFWGPGGDEKVDVQNFLSLIQGTNSFGIEDLAIYARYYRHVIVGDLGEVPDAGNIFVRRVRVRADIYTGHLKPEEVDRRFRSSLLLSTGGGDTVRLGGSNIQIVDCDFYGAGRSLFLSRARNGLVARSIFYNGRWGWYSISGSDGLIFEENQIIGVDLMSTGGGLNCLDGSNYSQNVYFAHNVFKLMHGWDREAMTSDAGGSVYFGKVASAQGMEIMLTGEPRRGNREFKGMGLFILDGRGKGQYRQVSEHKSKKVQVDREWDILPDESSQISITMLQRNYLIIGNEFHDATCAVQFYGTSINHIVAENKSYRAGGFHNIGMQYAGGWQPSWYVQFIRNEIIEGNQGFNGPLNQFPPQDSHVAALGQQYEPTKAAMNRFTIIRGNKLHSNARIEVGGACEDTVVDGNFLKDTDVGIEVGGSGSHRKGEPSGVLLYRNVFERISVPVKDTTQKAVLADK